MKSVSFQQMPEFCLSPIFCCKIQNLFFIVTCTSLDRDGDCGVSHDAFGSEGLYLIIELLHIVFHCNLCESQKENQVFLSFLEFLIQYKNVLFSGHTHT